MSTEDYDPSAEGQEMAGEVLSGSLDLATMSEIEQQLDYARRHGRSIAQWKKKCLEMVTLDESVATECFYALPRREKSKDTGQYETKIIKGPSARLAEILVINWGNCRAAARVVGEDSTGEFIRSQGTFYDLETNFQVGFEIKRRITNSGGKKFNADMIQVTGNAAASIAYRNSVLKGIPAALWKQIYKAAMATSVGNVTTLTKKRDEIIDIFQKMEIPSTTLFELFSIKGKDDIDADKLIEMKGLESAIRNGDTSVDSLLEELNKSKGLKQEQNPGMLKNKDQVAAAVDRARAAAAPPAQSQPQETTPENLDAEPPAQEQTPGEQKEGLFSGQDAKAGKKR